MCSEPSGVQTKINKPTALSTYLTFLLLVGAYFFSYFFRVSASVVLPQLAADWKLSASLTGFISSLYFYAYALMQPVSGALNDRFGPTRVVSAGITVTAVGAGLFALGANPLAIALGRLLTGLGLAPMLSGVLVYQAESFPKQRYAFFSGITYTVGNLGAVASVTPLGAALDVWGRFAVFTALACLNLTLAMLLIYTRDSDPVANRIQYSAVTIHGIWRQLQDAFTLILCSRQLRSMSIIWATSLGSLLALQGLWAVSWFQSAYSVQQASARFWATFIGIGVMVGNYIGGHLAPSPSQRKAAISGATLAYAATYIVLVTAIALHWPLVVVGVLGFLLGASAGISHDHLTAGVNDIATKGRGGALFGAMNLFTFTGVIIFQWGTGALLSFFSSDAAGFFSSAGYLWVFTAVAVLVGLSCLALLHLDAFADKMD
ncbi:MAG: MFS transporter [Firmicutes bacterium]|nr:MFS transporter [Bacillota bacterium]